MTNLGKLSSAICALGLAISANSAQAAVVTNISGLVVDGSNFNVTLENGSCASLYGNGSACSSSTVFPMTSLSMANDAATALKSYLADLGGVLPSDIGGCGANAKSCTIVIPYEILGAGNNRTADFTDVILNVNKKGNVTFSTGTINSGPVNETGSTYTNAVFSLNNPGGAVPEPATWALMLVGFGMVGYALRTRRRPEVRLTYA